MSFFSSKGPWSGSGLALGLHSSRWMAAQYISTGPTFFLLVFTLDLVKAICHALVLVICPPVVVLIRLLNNALSACLCTSVVTLILVGRCPVQADVT